MLPPMATTVLGVYILSRSHGGVAVSRATISRGVAALYIGIFLLASSGITLALRSWESFLLIGSRDSLLSASLGALGGVGLLLISSLPRIGASSSGSSDLLEVLSKRLLGGLWRLRKRSRHGC